MFSVTKIARLTALLLIIVMSAEALGAAQTKLVYLRTPPAIAHGDYLKDLFKVAYGKLGYRIEFLDVPGVREAELTVSSELTGMLARDNIVEETYPTLIRVNVPLFSYDLLLVGDRRQCFYCDYAQIKDLVYPRGGKIYERAISRLPKQITKTAVSGNKSVETLLLKQRVDAAIVSNFGVSKQIYDDPNFIVKTIETRFDYHYLAPEYAHLESPLTEVLINMQQSGELQRLKDQYQISETTTHEPLLPQKVFAVTGTWRDYAEPQNKGTYWQLLKRVFGDKTQLTTNSSTWMRSVRLFELGKADILVGTYLNDPEGFVNSTYHIDYEYEVIAVANTSKDLEAFMTGKKAFRVCAPEAYDIVLSELNSVNKLDNARIDVCLDKFENGAVDILLQYPHNLEALTTELPWQTFYQPAPLFVMFHKTKQGMALKQYFDKRMAELAKKGKIKDLFPAESDFRRAKITAF